MRASDPRIRIIAIAGSIGHHHQPLKNAPWRLGRPDDVAEERLAQRSEPEHGEIERGEDRREHLADEGGGNEGQEIRQDLLEDDPRSLTPDSFATETYWRSFIVSTWERITSVGPIQASAATMMAIVRKVTSRLSSEPAATTWIKSTGIGVRIWQTLRMMLSIQPPK